MAATWDAIVIGGGHNGLVAGAYLARAGARTVILERRHKTGGAAATDAPWSASRRCCATPTTRGGAGAG